jgi:hypothetical protein
MANSFWKTTGHIRQHGRSRVLMSTALMLGAFSIAGSAMSQNSGLSGAQVQNLPNPSLIKPAPKINLATAVLQIRTGNSPPDKEWSDSMEIWNAPRDVSAEHPTAQPITMRWAYMDRQNALGVTRAIVQVFQCDCALSRDAKDWKNPLGLISQFNVGTVPKASVKPLQWNYAEFMRTVSLTGPMISFRIVPVNAANELPAGLTPTNYVTVFLKYIH